MIWSFAEMEFYVFAANSISLSSGKNHQPQVEGLPALGPVRLELSILLSTARASLREGNGNPLQYSCLENPMDGGVGRLQSMGSLRVGHD